MNAGVEALGRWALGLDGAGFFYGDRSQGVQANVRLPDRTTKFTKFGTMDTKGFVVIEGLSVNHGVSRSSAQSFTEFWVAAAKAGRHGIECPRSLRRIAI